MIQHAVKKVKDFNLGMPQIGLLAVTIDILTYLFHLTIILQHNITSKTRLVWSYDQLINKLPETLAETRLIYLMT